MGEERASGSERGRWSSRRKTEVVVRALRGRISTRRAVSPSTGRRDGLARMRRADPTPDARRAPPARAEDGVDGRRADRADPWRGGPLAVGRGGRPQGPGAATPGRDPDQQAVRAPVDARGGTPHPDAERVAPRPAATTVARMPSARCRRNPDGSIVGILQADRSYQGRQSTRADLTASARPAIRLRRSSCRPTLLKQMNHVQKTATFRRPCLQTSKSRP
jgi:hypothetical protein